MHYFHLWESNFYKSIIYVCAVHSVQEHKAQCVFFVNKKGIHFKHKLLNLPLQWLGESNGKTYTFSGLTKVNPKIVKVLQCWIGLIKKIKFCWRKKWHPLRIRIWENYLCYVICWVFVQITSCNNNRVLFFRGDCK